MIYDELCLGQIKDASKKEFLKIIGALEKRGCQGIILGCTEIPLLVKPEDVSLPVFDTTTLHAHHAVDLSLKA